MKGKFYSVGLGPGDPRLMTFKAADAIKASDVVALPKSGAAENTALKIAGELVSGKRIIYCDMPMTRDKEHLELCHTKAAGMIGGILDSGQNVAFLTLGDPSVYSTSMYVHNKLARNGYDTEIIPGVTSFCAAASSLDISLCEGSDPLYIIPGSYGDISAFLDVPGTKVIMKSGRSLLDVKDKLKDLDNVQVMMVEKASMPDERTFYGADSIDGDAGYFTVVIVKDGDGGL